jgi:hypothetical protein
MTAKNGYKIEWYDHIKFPDFLIYFYDRYTDSSSTFKAGFWCLQDSTT